MNNHMLSFSIFQDLLSTNEMRSIFAEKSMIQKWIDVEVALALTEADMQIIPKEAADEIKKKGDVSLFNLQNIKEGIDFTWHPIVPFIREFKSLCDESTGEYIHWGATTQDIIDTGLILQVKDALKIVKRDLVALEEVLCNLAEKHKKTPMAGRTHGQHALPITFGYKVAVWADEVHRHLERVHQIEKRVLTGNLTGAVGTLASVGGDGKKVLEGVMRYLELDVPDISWHVARDRIADLTTVLGMIGATIGKIMKEIINLQKTEVNEVEEPFEFGKVGSSTMPQKRNPMASETVAAISFLLRQQASFGIECMMQEHERDMGPWMAEWEFVSEQFQLASGLLFHGKNILEGLTVNEDVMLENLKKSNQLIMAEAVMMKLANKVGRLEAHDLVYDISMQTFETKSMFSDALKDHQKVSGLMSDKEIDDMLDPLSYIGLSEVFVEDVIAKIRNKKSGVAKE